MDNSISYQRIAKYIFKEMGVKEESDFEHWLSQNESTADVVDGVLNLCQEKQFSSKDELLAYLNSEETSLQNIVSKTLTQKTSYRSKSRLLIIILAACAVLFILYLVKRNFQAPSVQQQIAIIHINEPLPFLPQTIRSNQVSSSSKDTLFIQSIEFIQKKQFNASSTILKNHCKFEASLNQESICLTLGYSLYKEKHFEEAEKVLNSFIGNYSDTEYETIEKAHIYLANTYFNLSLQYPSKQKEYLQKSVNSYKIVRKSGLLFGDEITNDFINSLESTIN